MLTPFLQAGAALLDQRMQLAEHDADLSVEEQEHVIHSVLLGQAVVTGLQAYAAGGDRELLELVNDLATTLDTIGPLGFAYLQRLGAINAAAGLDELQGVALLPEEYPHAVACVLRRAALAGCSVEPDAQARLDWAGYRPPAPEKDPLHPTRAALTPPATREPGRMAREQDLRRLAQSRLEGERNAALLLLHVNARDRLENAPLISVLDTAQVLLLSLRREHQDGADGAVTEALLGILGPLHQDLGAPVLPEARRFNRHQQGEVSFHSARARRLLRRLRAERRRGPTPQERRQHNALWDVLGALDRDLAAGLTPDPDLRAWLLVLGLQGLTTTARAPGMDLPPMVQLAAQVSGIDPLWAWERTQPRADLGADLHGALSLLVDCGQLLRLEGTGAWETWSGPVRRLVGQAAGHLFATARRAGLRLPEHGFLERSFGRFGPLRAVPLSAGEWEQVQDRYRAALQVAVETLTALHEQTDREETLQETAPDLSGHSPTETEPAAPKATPDSVALPAHVLAARARLAGGRVVLLGGVPSPHHHAALVRALGLRELDWIGSGEYAHGTHAHAHVTGDTAVVILAIRWMAHAHNTLRDVARAQDVPFVMHPGGLSPSSVAWQIMQQVSGQLDARG
ncbi:hypothetical protein GCM10010841_30300 [Deinococcus aerophilus]|uniref:DUF2325 domain-containing protein n=2 Tax=Deinococcus aerophilus TaxID=522488 RepID=A0ABQ2GZV8_9DEIO|nr:hypothetical protein GCM10010841_30300 [Deinococcus aerophilus]